MTRHLAALLAGLLFGTGLVLSRMVDPAKVLGFLDLFGAWDPSLAFVMVGAIVVTAPAFALARRMKRPLAASRFELPERRDVDGRLLGGSLVFGIGWGLVGLCPGPALTAIGLAPLPALVFVAALIAGTLLFRFTLGRSAEAPANTSG
ncbi:DUF6691 family protein [Aureimonas sp. SK2]|uniref:DUF6691 family protein n=1 Tax=Aureimonas sp. SK2 TaxID=3015992 RepID=UPI0024442EB6|nr:DUF6691 family protein [Aureimonas sp. SK2]